MGDPRCSIRFCATKTALITTRAPMSGSLISRAVPLVRSCLTAAGCLGAATVIVTHTPRWEPGSNNVKYHVNYLVDDVREAGVLYAERLAERLAERKGGDVLYAERLAERVSSIQRRRRELLDDCQPQSNVKNIDCSE